MVLPDRNVVDTAIYSVEGQYTGRSLYFVETIMKVLAFAKRYVDDRKLQKTPIYSAARFIRIVKDIDIANITERHLSEFRTKALAEGLSPHTVKGSLKDLRTLIRSTGRQIKVERVRVPQPDPHPVPHAHIDLIWPCLSLWAQQWLVFALWTAARLDDVIRLQQQLTATTSTLALTASKTGHRHEWPVPTWLQGWLSPQRLPYGKSYDWSGHLVRQALHAASKCCGIPDVLPNHVRDRALTEWSRADHTACEVLHGQSLGTLRHYLSPLEILSAASPRVKLPACFDAATDSTSRLINSFNRLDPSAQGLIVDTTERLARS